MNNRKCEICHCNSPDFDVERLSHFTGQCPISIDCLATKEKRIRADILDEQRYQHDNLVLAVSSQCIWYEAVIT
jgi:hypothetical protein